MAQTYLGELGPGHLIVAAGGVLTCNHMQWKHKELHQVLTFKVLLHYLSISALYNFILHDISVANILLFTLFPTSCVTFLISLSNVWISSWKKASSQSWKQAVFHVLWCLQLQLNIPSSFSPSMLSWSLLRPWPAKVENCQLSTSESWFHVARGGLPKNAKFWGGKKE